MSLVVRPVVAADVNTLIDMWVCKAQTGFLAPNAVTLAEAAYKDGHYVFTLLAKDKIVGLMGLIDMTELDPAEVAPEDEPTSILLWRLMIDPKEQRKGYGTAAITWAFDWARARGRPRMSVEVAQSNAVAIALYERLGYRATGVLYGDEAQMARDL